MSKEGDSVEGTAKGRGEPLSRLLNTTSLVYWYLSSRSGGSAGVREVQRAMRFSSSSTAQYHLGKLEETGLVAKDGHGNYSVVRRVQLGPMKDFASIGGRLIPKDLLYALVMTLVSIVYLVLLQSYFSSTLVLLALLPNVVSAAIFWYETWGTLKTRPSFKK